MPPPKPTAERIEYTKELFRELLRNRTQKHLASELGVDQSRVSAAVNDGRIGQKPLLAAAKLAGRPHNEALPLLLGKSAGVERILRSYALERLQDTKITPWRDGLTLEAITWWQIESQVTTEIAIQIQVELERVRRHALLLIERDTWKTRALDASKKNDATE